MSENIERKDNVLKRFAKAFYAKVRKAADWIKTQFAAVIDSKTTQDTAPARKATGHVLQVPRLLGRALTAVARVAANALMLLLLGAAMIVGGFAGAIVLITTNVIFIAYKVIYGVGLALATPYLLVMNALGDEWSLYAKMWTPSYWKCQSAQQVAAGGKTPAVLTDEDFEMDIEERADALLLKLAVETPAPEKPVPATVTAIEHKTGKPAPTPKKGHPTPKQTANRPARLPKPVTA